MPLPGCSQFSVRFARLAAVVAFVLLASFGTPASAATDYWQQHVDYTIKVRVLDSIHTLDGVVSVHYTNNSPDTLREVYFHLYANAFQPGSMMDVRSDEVGGNAVHRKLKLLPETEWGKYTIERIRVDGQPCSFRVTGTIMRVALTAPLPPGGKISIDVPFREQMPRLMRRGGWMSTEGISYSAAQWYPKLAEYDREGWHIQEYIAREFFGVWGNFYVELTLPSRYVVGATGSCVNPDEVGHGYEQIAKGIKQGSAEPTRQATGETTWKFEAKNVHDFAWVADPEYIHEWATWRDTVTVHALYQLDRREQWKNAIQYSIHSLETFSTLYGPYGYRNFTNSHAGDGGMEYPQLIMITGDRSEQSLAGVTAHEIGHQWFYGMLASNESREAFLDEGFTNRATSEATVRLFGRHQRPPGYSPSWLDWFIPEFDSRYDNFRGYQDFAVTGYEEPLVIPHDWARETVNAGQHYGKTQAALSALEYVIGDSAFASGMKEYFRRWSYKHPHIIDFQRTMEDVSGADLDWFFDQWFRSSRTVDYAIWSVKSERTRDGSYSTTICAKNQAEGVMPLDLTLHYTDGTSGAATIPLATNHDGGFRKSEKGRLFFPDWDWVAERYQGTGVTPKEVSWVELDTTERIQDLRGHNDWSQNLSSEWEMMTRHLVFFRQLYQRPPLDAPYSVLRPIVWWQQPTGVKLGIGSTSGMNNLYSGDWKVIVKPSATDTSLIGDRRHTNKIDFRLQHTMRTKSISRLSTLSILARRVNGISTFATTFTAPIRPHYYALGPTHTLYGSIELVDRTDSLAPHYHHAWDAQTMRVLSSGHRFVSADQRTKAETKLEASFWNSSMAFSKYQLSFSQQIPVYNEVGLLLGAHVGTSTGNLPRERAYYLSMANPMEEQGQEFFRGVADIDPKSSTDAGLFVEGGGGLRGYVDQALSGKHLLASHLDISLPNPISSLGAFASTFTLGLFSDFGWVGSTWDHLNRQRAFFDAGATVGVSILQWLPWQLRGVAEQYARIPVVKVHFPLYVNRPSAGEAAFGFRYCISLGTQF